jgi:hypothetical protein
MPIKFTPKKIKGGDLLFFLAYGLFLVAGIFSTTLYYKYYVGTLHKVIIVSVLLLLIGKELCENRATRKAVFGLVVSAGLLLLVDRIGSITVAVMFILIWTARKIEFRRIAKFTLIISAALFVFIVCSSYLGIVENVQTTRANGAVRHYLGFRYSLFGPAILYNITTLYLYIKKVKIRWVEILILFAINYWVYRQTDSRLSFYLTVLVMAVCVVLKYFPDILEKRRLLCFGMICSFWISAFVSIGLMAVYDSNVSWMSSLNNFLGTRLSLGQNSILEYGITVFGQRVSWNGWGLDANGEVSSQSLSNYNYVDCGYLSVLQHYGVFVSLICLVALTAAMVKCYRKKNYYLLVLLTFIAIHAMIDDLVIYLFYNTLWFAVATPIDAYTCCRQASWNKQQLLDRYCLFTKSVTNYFHGKKSKGNCDNTAANGEPVGPENGTV